ncbi:MAG: hypothetical protein K2L98_04410 [Bacilli bacterium]|nr:hypothetical protein [Bacilli bacterium]
MLRISQVKIDCLLNQEDNLKKNILKKLRINDSELIEYKIIKRSIDARDKAQVFYVYEVDARIKNEEAFLKHNKDKSISVSNPIKYNYEFNPQNKKLRPIIVGLGPAGLFASYILILNGIKPIIIERGEDVDTRVKTIESFWENNVLNENSNVQFGEGGAGTFSDGKLNTLTKDKEGRSTIVLETI